MNLSLSFWPRNLTLHHEEVDMDKERRSPECKDSLDEIHRPRVS